MKKHLLRSIVGFAALFSVGQPCFGQGHINLDNYNSTLKPLITYGAGLALGRRKPGFRMAGPTGSFGRLVFIMRSEILLEALEVMWPVLLTPAHWVAD